MKLSILVCVLAVLIPGGLLAVRSQDQDEENVRGAFLTSRSKEKPPQNSTTSRPARRRPRASQTQKSGTSTTTGTSTGNVSGNFQDSKSTDTKTTAPRMGLGLTLFTADANGLAVRVDPTHEFRRGERVRILLETNADGYLYIFNTTDNGQPVMIYPNAEIDEGGNYLQSHVPFEIPSSAATEERLRWFTFDQNAGTERLYFVFTREPIAGVPIEDDLTARCRRDKTSCPWKPNAEMWSQLQRQMNTPLKTAKSQKYGRAQTRSEQVASTRGIGLSQEDPEPSLIMMAVATSTNSLVTALDLVHK